MVNLTRIYTRTGDAGKTRLGDMSETTKTDLRLRAYADVDETNATSAGAGGRRARRRTWSRSSPTIQNDLFDVGADFCTPGGGEPGVPAAAHRARLRRAPRGLVRPLQRPALQTLRSFILNGGTVARGPPARRPHRVPARGALGLGGARGVRRLDERPRDQVPQPALATCCSSWPATRTARTATCSGCPAASAARSQRRTDRRHNGRGSRPIPDVFGCCFGRERQDSPANRGGFGPSTQQEVVDDL